MKGLRDMGGSNKKASSVKTVHTVKTSKGLVDFVPTFEHGDAVNVKSSIKDSSKTINRIKGFTFVVDYCKVADLGDMVVEVVYLQKTDKDIQNPYLVEYFELILKS